MQFRKSDSKSTEESPPIQRTGMAMHASLARLTLDDDIARGEAPRGILKADAQAPAALLLAAEVHGEFLPHVQNLDRYLDGRELGFRMAAGAYDPFIELN